MEWFSSTALLLCVAVQASLVLGKYDDLVCPSTFQDVVAHCVCKNNCLAVTLRLNEQKQLPENAEYKCLDNFLADDGNLQAEFDNETYLFSCKTAGYRLVGDEKVTCLENKLSAARPVCLPSGITVLELILALLVGLLLLALIIFFGVTYRLRSRLIKTKPSLAFNNENALQKATINNTFEMNKAGTSNEAEDNIYDDADTYRADLQDENLYDDVGIYRR